MSDRDTAFAEYFAARSSAMRATAFLLCGTGTRAEDLVQTACTRPYLRWNRVQRHESPDPYVRKVLISAFIDEGRCGWRRERPHDARIERLADPRTHRVPGDADVGAGAAAAAGCAGAALLAGLLGGRHRSGTRLLPSNPEEASEAGTKVGRSMSGSPFDVVPQPQC
jgi:DNA-directed RNA polymerase specialized sigma24 family protein